jgi:hypothetical protein
MRTAAVGRHYGIHESTVNFIKKSEDTISGSIKASVQPSANVSCISCHEHFLKKMEKALGVSL